MIANFVDNQLKDFAWMADQVVLTRQQVRNIALNYSKTDRIEKNKAGRKPKLGEDHIDFIKKFYGNHINIGKTVTDLYNQMTEYFDLDYDYINPSTLIENLMI